MTWDPLGTLPEHLIAHAALGVASGPTSVAFTDLTDTFSAYDDLARHPIVVNTAETGVEASTDIYLGQATYYGTAGGGTMTFSRPAPGSAATGFIFTSTGTGHNLFEVYNGSSSLLALRVQNGGSLDSIDDIGNLVRVVNTSRTVSSGTGLSGGGDLSSNRSLAIDQSFSPTWTGTHTFSLETVHNGGVDVGTSGRFDSNVVNGAAASNFLFQPTTALTAGVDRYLWRLNTQATTSAMTVFSNGQVEWNGLLGSNNGFLQVAGTLPTGPYLGISFTPSAFTSSGTIGPFSTCVGGGFFQAQVTGTSTFSQVGGYFKALQSSTGTTASAWAALFESARTGNNTTTDLGCIYLRDNSGQSKGTLTTWRGIYGASVATMPVASNRYWIDLTELATGTGAGYRTSILLQQSTSGYKALCFRDQGAWINSNDANHLDLNATTSVDCNADFDISAKNVITDTSTGTKIGTATTQKLAFFNSTPIVQPANTVPVQDVLVNLGLKASGWPTKSLPDNVATDILSVSLPTSNTGCTVHTSFQLFVTDGAGNAATHSGIAIMTVVNQGGTVTGTIVESGESYVGAVGAGNTTDSWAVSVSGTTAKMQLTWNLTAAFAGLTGTGSFSVLRHTSTGITYL